MSNYWMVVTSPEDFAVSRELGYPVSGFKDNRRGRRIYAMEPGDQIVYYINRIHKFGAVTEVAGRPYRDDKTRIWVETDEIWPLRIPLKLHAILDDEQLVDVRRLLPKLSFVTERIRQTGWGVAFQGSLHRIPEDDFELIASEIRRAAHPRIEPRHGQADD
ncbi:MAG TPA: EVE domain-containing protein [Armatimonadota bacterium]|nr:EVE domain-containing protein [Armatimonadota bacterium]